MKTVLHKTRNYLEKITEVYVFASSDSDGEGVIGKSMLSPDGGLMMMPFVCADKERMESLRPLAKQISKQSGKKIKLLKFTCREELEEFTDKN